VKKLLRVTLLLLISFVLVSCAGEIAITLDTPQNVTITDGVLTWDAVTDATAYTVIVDSNSYTVSVTTFDLNTLDLPVGTYPVHIVATQGLNLSEPSTTINFVVEAVVIGVPQNVAINDGVVTWSAVTDASSYVVHVGTETHTVTVTTFDLSTLTLTEGNYSVFVVAMIGTDASSPSTTVSYFVGGTTLDVPQNVAIAAGILTWSAVAGADSYVVYVDEDSYTVTVTTYDLTTLDLAPGDHDVFVAAKAGTDLSASSTVLNYFIESANLSEIYANSLALLDPTYEPDMVAEDFEDDYEYQDYLDMSQMVYAYSTAVVEMGMTQVEALALFAHVATTPARMQTIDSMSAMMAEIDSYDMFDMSSTDLATMLYELAIVGVTIHIGDLEDYIAYNEQDILDLEQEISDAQALLDFTAIYDQLAVYATPEELVQLTYFLTGEYENTGNVLNNLQYLASDLRYSFNDPFYLEDGDEYLQMFYNILLDAMIAGNGTLLETFINSYPLNSLYDIAWRYESIMYRNEDIVRRENEIATMNELSVFLTDEKDLVMDSATGVVDYLTLIYDTVPISMVGLLDNFMENGELTMPEYFMLKDEVVDILLTTLPSSEDFAGIYTLLFTVADAFDVATVEDYLPYADFLGEVDYTTIDLALTFIDGIDQQTVQDVMDIVDGMVIPGECYYDEFWEDYYCDGDDVDFEKAIELAVYVGNYIDTFTLDNAAKFETLTGLSEDEQVEELVNLFANSIKTVMAQEMDPDSYAMASMVIDEVLDNYTEIMAAVDVINTVGMSVVSEFLLNEGQMFLDLYDLINNGSGDLDDPLFLADVEAVLAQMVDYKAAMFNELDETSIETLLAVLKVPLKIGLMIQEIEITDFDATFDAMLVPVSTMLDLVITMLNDVDETVVIDIVSIANGMVTPGECYYDEYWDEYYCNGDDVDFEKAIELAVYIGTYLDTFKTENSAKFDAVNALFTDGQIETLLGLLAGIAKDQMEPQMDPDEFTMASAVIDEVLANYDVIVDAIAVIHSAGIGVVDQFLLNEGQMFLDLYDLINNGSGDLDNPLFLADVEAVLAQMVDYKAALLNELDEASIEALLNALRVPLKIGLMMQEIEITDFDTTFDAMLVPVSTMLDLVFTLLNDVDETVVIDIVSIANGMVTPGIDVYDEFDNYMYTEPDIVDFDKVIELAVYVGTYLDTFKTENSIKFDAVNALFTDGQIETLLGLLAGIAKDQMEPQMDPDEFATVSLVIDEVLADYDNIIAATQVIGSIGGNVVDEFLSNEGQMFLDIYDLVNNGPGDLTDPLFVADVEALIAQALNYNAAIIDTLDIANVQTLLKLVRIPLVVQLSMDATMEPADVNIMFNALLVPVSTVIVNIISIEEDLVAAIDGLDLSVVATWNITGDDASIALLVLALDDTLTTLNEALIFTSITIVSDNILKNADVLVLNESTVEDVDLMIGDVETMFTDLFAEIHAIALLDFTVMTQVDIDRLYALMDMLPTVGSEEPA